MHSWSNWIFVLFTPHLMSHAQYTWSSLKLFQAQKYLQVKNCNDFKYNVRLSLCLCCDFLLHPQLVILEFWKLEICKFAKENPRNLHFLSLSFSLFLFHFPLWPWRECTDSRLHHSWLRTSSIEIERFRSQIVVVSNFGAFNFVHISDTFLVGCQRTGPLLSGSHGKRKRRQVGNKVTAKNWQHGLLAMMVAIFFSS